MQPSAGRTSHVLDYLGRRACPAARCCCTVDDIVYLPQFYTYVVCVHSVDCGVGVWCRRGSCVRNAFLRSGFVRDTPRSDDWLGLWARPLREEEYMEMNEYQKVPLVVWRLWHLTRVAAVLVV